MTGPGADVPPVVVRHPTPRELARQLNAERPSVAAEPDALPFGPVGPVLPPPPLPERLARGDAVPMLLFAVGGERFFLPLSDVREALDAPLVHPVPRMQGATRGVVAVRGTLLPARDPAAVLGVGAASGGAGLVVPGERPQVLLVDDVLDAVDLRASALRPLPAAVGGAAFLLGAAPAGPTLGAVLDLPPLLAALDLSDR